MAQSRTGRTRTANPCSLTMIETMLALVPDYGAWLMLVATFCSCLALPIPASLLMLTGGAFAATGDLALISVAGAALTGAVAGDQVGFFLGRTGGGALLQRIARDGPRSIAIAKASQKLANNGFGAVFLSRWLFSPLGPWVNLAAGAVGLRWLSFTVAGVIGEAIWVAVYIGPGYYFASNISDLADTMGAMLGFLAAGVLALGLGIWLIRSARAHHADRQTNIA
jgi:membrane-associated protein